MTETITAPGGESPRSLRAIAGEILADWKTMAGNQNNPAYPYVHAMRGLEAIGDQYGEDSGESIVRYFLANARGWRGDVARRVKAELKDMVGMK